MSKQITLTLDIAPAAAIRASRASCGEHTLVLSDADVASLTEEQRDTLARHVAGERGHGMLGQAMWYHKLTDHAEPVASANLDTLRALLDVRREHVRAAVEAYAAKVAAVDARYLEKLAAPVEHELVWLHYDGSTSSNWGLVQTDLPIVPTSPYVFYGDPGPSAEVKAAFADYLAKIKAQREAAIEAAMPTVREIAAKEAAVKAEAEAAEKAEYDALYARLPAPLRTRDAAGFASKTEVRDAIEGLILSDADLPNGEGWNDETVLTTLTDAGFAALQELRERVPAGAVIEPLKVWDVTYRPAGYDEEGDQDGEVSVKTNVRKVFRVTWKHGGVTATAVVPFPAAPAK